MIFAVSFSLNDLVNAVFKNKYLRFVLDFFIVVIWAIIYFCVSLAYRDCVYRFTDSFFTILGFLSYFLTIYKPLNRVFNKIGGKLNKAVKKQIKKLKFDKKSFKKLLHFNR